MKTATLFSPALFALLLAAPAAGQAQFTQGQSFLGSLPPSGSGMDGAMLASSAPDSAAFADGTRAINESRWADAVNHLHPCRAAAERTCRRSALLEGLRPKQAGANQAGAGYLRPVARQLSLQQLDP